MDAIKSYPSGIDIIVRTENRDFHPLLAVLPLIRDIILIYPKRCKKFKQPETH
jgi:hypothetical protein